MDLPVFYFTLGSIPFFASRIFGSVFCISVLAKLQAEGFFEGLNRWKLFEVDLVFPDWFIGPGFMGTMGVLALLESMAQKNTDLAEFFGAFESPIKGFGNAIFTKIVTVKFNVKVASAMTVMVAAFDWTWLWGIVTGLAVWLLATMRNQIRMALTDLDPDDDLRIRKLFSWAEDGWVVTGSVFLLALPLLALIMAGLSVLTLVTISGYLKIRERKQSLPCQHCGHADPPTALVCGNCGVDRPNPVQVGIFGQPTSRPVEDRHIQEQHLAWRKRCPRCASRLPKKAIKQHCPTCSTVHFPSSQAVDAYFATLDAKLPKTLLVCTLLSLIPLVGLVPGIIYYRLSLIAGLRGYLPRSKGCLTRWLARLGVLLLLSFQWVPLLGAISLPLICLMNFGLHRKAVQMEKRRCFPASTGT